jgi:hypothetical protein
MNPAWTDVTQQALRDDLRHNTPTPSTQLSVEWNMPTLESDADKVRKIEGPGLMWGFAPFIARDIQGAYLKDQTLGIRDPHLRFMASTKQQAFKAVDEWNQRLEEFALSSVVPELPGAAASLRATTMGARLFARMTAKTPKSPGAIRRLFSWVFGRSGPAGREAAKKIFLTEQEAVLAVIKDGKILASTRNSLLSHEVFVQRAIGALPEGAEVVTIGKLDGLITAFRSRTFHGNELPASQSAIDAARRVYK